VRRTPSAFTLAVRPPSSASAAFSPPSPEGSRFPRCCFPIRAGESCAHPFVVYRWIEGLTLNDFCRRAAPGEMDGLAEPLGTLAARVAGVRADEISGLELDVVDIAAELDLAERQLRSGPARVRLGETLADGLRARLTAAGPQLLALDGSRGLLHGDFGGRNVLVRAGKAGAWEISGLLDWETAARGAALWDVGSLFRYPRRYSPAFRDAYARGYRAAGGDLGSGWWWTARLLDATRLVRILGQERELPNVFAECRDVIASMLDGEPC
jgi:Ser/Thr protein kinase RdoA (MazF antagonist)